ncbi:MAG: hypothetical protein HOP19_14985 [Acidobacteria bacterium]|nr:hypothetical protein [Acidobacteriota bacterium]
MIASLNVEESSPTSPRQSLGRNLTIPQLPLAGFDKNFQTGFQKCMGMQSAGDSVK